LNGTLADAARWAASVPLTLRHLVPAIAFARTRPEQARRLLREWGSRERELFGVDLTVLDENDGDYGPPPYLFVHLNQSSHIESWIFSAIRTPIRYIVNLRYAAFPLVGWTQVALGAIVVVRKWKAQGRRQMERAREILEGGENVAVSIEGFRSRDGSLGPYKKAPVVLAIQAQATLVPFVTIGARERLPHGTWRVRPGPVELRIVRAIPTKGLTYAARDEVLARLRAAAEEALSKAPM